MPASKNRRLLIASLASALTIPAAALPADEQPEKVHCYGVNKCKGVGDCGGPGQSCAGSNACKRQGFIDMDKDTCLKLDGGRLTREAEKPAAQKEEKK